MYDIIVIGGGHAGCEAALAPARMGLNTLLVTANLKKVAHLPCNPSIGGPAKGVVVREIDALGGEMGKNVDKSQIQMRLLNTSKGPGVQALRAQADKVDYPKNMLATLLKQENLTIIEEMVDDLIVQNNEVKGVVLENNEKYYGKVIILTAGTYMKAKIMISNETWSSGPDNDKPSLNLSDNLRKLGFKTMRLKTGTPPRVAIDSIDYDKTIIQPGDMYYHAFSYDTTEFRPLDKQIPCYLTYTTEETHSIIMQNISKSSMYGAIEKLESKGPRYCPSIEDKIVRFADKPRHQIFLEPESIYIPEIYVQGLSTSLPKDIQEKIIHTVPGLENCKIVRYAYAIEYDAIDPKQLWPTLEAKSIKGLFFAGQVNGTSGYEEAAGQGLMAGINAALKIMGKEPFILKRNEAYIGVMIDDLVTKGTKEPYRLLTSRAEYRLLLRHDNADIRLREYGYNFGLIDERRYLKFKQKLNKIVTAKSRLEKLKINPSKEVNEYLTSINSAALKDGITPLNLLKRPEINYEHLMSLLKEEVRLSKAEIQQIEIQVKYEGYIKKMMNQVEKLNKLEARRIPEAIDYNNIPNLAIEAKLKLNQIKPLTIGQAGRISGVNPSDIAILTVYIETYRSKHE